MDNLKFGVQLANVSIRCSSHPQSKSEARCENAGALYIGMDAALARPCSSVTVEVEVLAPM